MLRNVFETYTGAQLYHLSNHIFGLIILLFIIIASQITEDGRQKAEDRRQTTEDSSNVVRHRHFNIFRTLMIEI